MKSNAGKKPDKTVKKVEQVDLEPRLTVLNPETEKTSLELIVEEKKCFT